MRVLLVNPSLFQSNVGHYQKAVEKLRGCYPSLGLLFVAAALEEKGHCVKVFDVDIELGGEHAFRQTMLSHRPDVVGLHMMTWTFQEARRIIALVREMSPSTLIIAGGAAVTSSPYEAFVCGGLDYGVIGEGERTIVQLIDAIEQRREPSDVDGIIFRKDGEILQTRTRELIKDLDSIPMAARHLVPLERYHDVFSLKEKFTTLMTSRGCPYQCIYCDRKNRMGTRWRTFSNIRIVGELKHLVVNYGISEVMFFDDEFIVDREKTLALCKMIQQAGLRLLWECRARVDTVDEELLASMRDAGCYRIRFGFESGDDEILKRLKKGITVEQSRRCAKIAKQAGIEIFGYFMAGCPGETPQTLDKTLKLALEIDPDFAVFSKTILIPGSELFDWAVSEGMISPDYWKKFFYHEQNNTAPAISTNILPEKEVDRFIARANRAFYLRSSFILKRLKAIRSFSQLKKQTRLAVALFL